MEGNKNRREKRKKINMKWEPAPAVHDYNPGACKIPRCRSALENILFFYFMSFDVHAQQVLLGTTENNLRIKRNLVLEFMLVFKLSHVVTYPAPKLTLLDFG